MNILYTIDLRLERISFIVGRCTITRTCIVTSLKKNYIQQNYNIQDQILITLLKNLEKKKLVVKFFGRNGLFHKN